MNRRERCRSAGALSTSLTGHSAHRDYRERSHRGHKQRAKRPYWHSYDSDCPRCDRGSLRLAGGLRAREDRPSEFTSIGHEVAATCGAPDSQVGHAGRALSFCEATRPDGRRVSGTLEWPGPYSAGRLSREVRHGARRKLDVRRFRLRRPLRLCVGDPVLARDHRLLRRLPSPRHQRLGQSVLGDLRRRGALVGRRSSYLISRSTPASRSEAREQPRRPKTRCGTRSVSASPTSSTSSTA